MMTEENHCHQLNNSVTGAKNYDNVSDGRPFEFIYITLCCTFEIVSASVCVVYMQNNQSVKAE